MVLDEFGEEKVSHIAHVTREIETVKGQDVVFVCVQTGYHQDVLAKILPHLEAGQILAESESGISVNGLCHWNWHSGRRDHRRGREQFHRWTDHGTGRFKVGFRNVRNPIGIYPVHQKDYAVSKLDQLGTPFAYADSVIETALHNPNMIVHTVGAVMSIPRIEATGGDYCMYHEVFTPSAWKILEALDQEKMNIFRTSWTEAGSICGNVQIPQQSGR